MYTFVYASRFEALTASVQPDPMKRVRHLCADIHPFNCC